MTFNLKRVTNFYSFLFVVVSAATLTIFLLGQKAAKENEAWVNHTHKVILQSTNLLSHMKDAETGQRGYLLTLEDSYLAPYYDGISATLHEMAALKELTSDNKNQQIRLEQLSDLVKTKFAVLQETIDFANRGSYNQALELVKSDLGKLVMDDIRSVLDEFVKEEKELLKVREERYITERTKDSRNMVLAFLLLVLLVSVSTLVLRFKVIRPISKLTFNTKQFGAGQADKIEAVNAPGEVGELANAFEEMSQDVRNSIEAMREAKQEADAASLAKGRFVANMSHEIRTPINGVYGILQILQRGNFSDDPSYSKKLEQALFSCETLKTIIDDILDFSKIEANRLELETVPLNIAQVADTAVSLMADMAKEKALNLNLHIEPGLHEQWLGDPVRIKQILLNILSNAIKFTEIGKINLHVSNSIDDGKERLVIDILDTGLGMTDEALSRLFERFEQADSSTTRRFGGTGLGMPITKSLVTLMGGDIEVSSDVGKGTRFLVSLPLERTTKEAQEKESHDSDLASQTPEFPGKKVVIVEDNKVNQLVCESMLKPTQVETDIAEDGAVGVELVERTMPDLVLMDIQMPVMDGIEACKMIKQIFPDMPVIALTANVLASDVSRYLEEGFDDCLGKPLEIDKLYNMLSQYLKQEVDA